MTVTVSGISPCEDVDALFEPLERSCARIVAGQNAARLQPIAERGDDRRQTSIHRLRQRLHDQVVAVIVDDQRRQQIGFAVDEAVGGRVDAERLAKRDRGVEAAADQRVRVESVGIAVGEHAQRDLRPVAVQRMAERARARSAHQHDVARLRAHVGHVRTIDPRMAVAQPLLAASRDHHARRHVAHIVQSLPVRIAIGADHAGFALKEHLKQTLAALGHTVDDHGTHSEAPVDYPPICSGVGRAVAEGRAERGIVLGGSGRASRSRPTRLRAFALRSATISIPPGCRANTTTQSSRWAAASWRSASPGNPGAVARDAVRRQPPSAPPRSDSGGRNAAALKGRPRHES